MKGQIKMVVFILVILWGFGIGKTQVHYTHKLEGRITFLNSGFKPVVGAQVTPDEEAHAKRTDADGRFTLVFDRMEAGMEVNLRVRKGDLVVVNEKELSVTLKKDVAKQIKLFMCEKKQLDELRAQYYDISIANITRRYREEMERLSEENKLSWEVIAQLEKEKPAVLDQAKELADKFARVNFDDISELRRKAFEYFKAGEIKKAIETLDFDTLRGNIAKADAEISRVEGLKKETEERKENAQEQRRQTIEGLVDKAWMCRADFQFDLAKQCFEAAVKEDPENFSVTRELALFLYKQNQCSESLVYFEKLLSLADREADRAGALGDLGNLYQKNRQFHEALQVYSEALQIYKQLAEKNPHAFLKYVAAAQSNLGVLYKNNNQFSEALQTYSEALAIRKQLAEKNPGDFLPDVATTQNNLGALYYANNRFKEALQAYSEALAIRKQLAEKNPGDFLPDVAMTQNNLGALYYANNLYNEALLAIKEALKIYKQLAEKNPGDFLPKVAMIQNNLGNLYRDNNLFQEALQACTEALKIFNQLAEKNPDAFLQYVAATQHNQGLIYFSQNHLHQAIEILSQAVTTREQLTLKNPRAFEIELCQSMIALGGYVHLQLLEETDDLSHLEKADSLVGNAIERLKKYPEVPRANELLKIAQDIMQQIDEAKEMLEK